MLTGIEWTTYFYKHLFLICKVYLSYQILLLFNLTQSNFKIQANKDSETIMLRKVKKR